LIAALGGAIAFAERNGIAFAIAENLAVAVSGARAPALSFYSPAEARGRRDKALELLGRFGLTEMADRPISELAGGVRKAIDIAALLGRFPSPVAPCNRAVTPQQ